MKKNKFYFRLLILPLIFLLGGWGNVAHQKMNSNVFNYLPAEMNEFDIWIDYFINHASDADDRKSEDPDESPKHSINLDSYQEFILNGYISQNIDSFIILHGRNFVYDQGILPWAIIFSYDSLKNCFIKRDWKNARKTAVDLCHYVGDCHMPFHLKKDSGYDELHQRFENDLIDKFADQIIFENDRVVVIDKVEDFVFKTIYQNYLYVDSIIYADDYAQRYSGSKKSDLYFSTLWNQSEKIIKYLFSGAAKSIAGLIYSAWLEAGKPPINSTSSVSEGSLINDFELYQNYPNPFNSMTKIKYSIPNSAGTRRGVFPHIDLKVYNVLGNEVANLVNEEKPAGSYELEFNAEELSSGIYYYKLTTGNNSSFKKMLLLK